MRIAILFAVIFVAVAGTVAAASEVAAVHPTAIFPFAERGAGVKGYGEKVRDILFASLAAYPELHLVDRADMNKILDEHELNLSGIVAPGQAVQVGRLTGAKILLTGSVIEANKTIYVVAKIIGTETSRVFGESVKGRTTDELGPLVEQLAEKVAERIGADAKKLVAMKVKQVDRIKALNKALGKAKRPVVFISVAERHIGQASVDPAAQTELALYCSEAGFKVIDSDSGKREKADVTIIGEGFSELAGRRGELVSVKARLEVKAVDTKTGRVVAIDRQASVEVDLTEQIAGKKALQEAAADIAERLLPKVVKGGR